MSDIRGRAHEACRYLDALWTFTLHPPQKKKEKEFSYFRKKLNLFTREEVGKKVSCPSGGLADVGDLSPAQLSSTSTRLLSPEASE